MRLQVLREDINYKVNTLGWRWFTLSPDDERELREDPCKSCGGQRSEIAALRDTVTHRYEIYEVCCHCGDYDRV